MTLMTKLANSLQRPPSTMLAPSLSKDGKKAFHESASREEVLSKNAQQYPLLREFVAMETDLKKIYRTGETSSGRRMVLRLLRFISEVSILALGDSLTQGYGLAQQDGFVPQLNKWLLEQGNDVSIINGGVSGDTSAGGLERVAWALEEDVDILMVALGGNDLLRGIDPTSTRFYLDQILAIGTEKGLRLVLIGMSAPNNFGPDYKKEFDAIYPDLAAKYDATLVDRFMAPLLDKAAAGERLEPYLQQDMLHPNVQGVELIVHRLAQFAKGSAKWFRWKLTKRFAISTITEKAVCTSSRVVSNWPV